MPESASQVAPQNQLITRRGSHDAPPGVTRTVSPGNKKRHPECGHRAGEGAEGPKEAGTARASQLTWRTFTGASARATTSASATRRRAANVAACSRPRTGIVATAARSAPAPLARKPRVPLRGALDHTPPSKGRPAPKQSTYRPPMASPCTTKTGQYTTASGIIRRATGNCKMTSNALRRRTLGLRLEFALRAEHDRSPRELKRESLPQSRDRAPLASSSSTAALWSGSRGL